MLSYPYVLNCLLETETGSLLYAPNLLFKTKKKKEKRSSKLLSTNLEMSQTHSWDNLFPEQVQKLLTKSG